MAKTSKRIALSVQRLTVQDWFDQRFTAHFSRLVLMFSDRYYSSLSEPKIKWQDSQYTAYANTQTDPITNQKQYHQKLDEHNIGVGQNAFLLARALPKLKTEQPNLGYNRVLEKGIIDKSKSVKTFSWQDDAYKLALSCQEDSEIHGFFGINMASTGKGKTLANARIMYALSDAQTGCRFSVALGLRTLTKQTADALAEKLDLDKDQIAVLIGSQAFKQLYGNPIEDNQSELQKRNQFNGSESLDGLADEDFEVLYDERQYEGVLAKWLTASPKVQKMLHAPVLVSTIDYLTPATEGTRGGKQIAPMLRLYSADLVLDEPDDYGLEDLPALCRLVNWAGMLGSKILLSTATMPPALVNALFQAYQAGWKFYSEVNTEKGITENTCCAWFDEFDCKSAILNDRDFPKEHHLFVEKRITSLTKEKKILRKARFLPVSCSVNESVCFNLALVIHQAIHQLHTEHQQTHSTGKTLSIGLVRMANINPLVAVAQQLIAIPSQQDVHIHYCIYHGQYPLALRSHIEERLDAALKRDNEETIWKIAEIEDAITKRAEKHHIFVVLATSVAEVGRDHDYDWAIAEPSSMRSLIQLAGRIQRHRQKEPKTENFLILTKNVKALCGKIPAYCKPGFEVIGKHGNNTRLLASQDLNEVLAVENIQHINAIPRIQSPKSKEPKKDRDNKYLDFVEMEQRALFQRLLGIDSETEKATYWWKNNATWCAEIQRHQPFRKSQPDAPYCLAIDKQGNKYWAKKDDTKYPVCYPPAENIENIKLEPMSGNSFWISLDAEEIYSTLAEKFSLSTERCSQKFGELRLRIDEKKVIDWYYNPYLGVFNEI